MTMTEREWLDVEEGEAAFFSGPSMTLSELETIARKAEGS
jgi:hypothetical protein